MGMNYAAFGGKNTFGKGSGITIHKFPPVKESALRKKWISAMKTKEF